VEPEVLMDGNHSIERCEEVLQVTLQTVFAALQAQRVFLEGMLLKTSMVLPGKESQQRADPSFVAEATLRCLRRTVPTAVPGIAFLSGGQSELEATERLNALCRTTQLPWKLSFSYGRALQDGAMKEWKGSSLNRVAAQGALRHRARCNAVATLGRYSARTEQPAVAPAA
jgi:fructose-bisphosphate aldolase class I